MTATAQTMMVRAHDGRELCVESAGNDSAPPLSLIHI